MEYRQLGKTGIEVSAIAFGCWPIVGGANWGPQDEQDSQAALYAAFEAGITFYDTAEAYGSGLSEQLVAKTLGGHRDEIILATKVSNTNFSPPALKQACERSLQNLATDRIDLYQLHWPSRRYPIAETLQTLEELRREGKIRAYGLSNFGPQDLDEALHCGYTVSSNQMAYNLLFRAVEHDVLPRCEREGISVLAYSPLMQGLLTGKFRDPDQVPESRARTRIYSGRHPESRHGEEGAETEAFGAIEDIRKIAEKNGQSMLNLALAWLLKQPAMGSVIVGARNRRQGTAMAEAAALDLDDATVHELSAATEPLKRKLGKNLDMWQGSEDSRIR